MSLDKASSDLHLELPPEQLLWNVPQVIKYPTGLTGLSCSGLYLCRKMLRGISVLRKEVQHSFHLNLSYVGF